MTLVECGYFDPATERSLQHHLDLAYDSFKRFIAERKISCSQPPFQEKMVTQINEGFMAVPFFKRITCPPVLYLSTVLASHR